VIDVTSTTVQTRLQNQFENIIVKWHLEKGVRDGRVHASSILADDFCLREMVLSIFFKKTLEYKYPSLLRKLKYGWEIHEVWQEALTHNMSEEALEDYLQLIELAYPGIAENTMDEYRRVRNWRSQFVIDGCLAIEVEKTHHEWVKKWDLSFTPDAITEHFMFKQWLKFVVEIKGYRPEVYEQALKDRWNCPEYLKAVQQCNLYMHLTGIHQGIILFENKATQDFKLWTIKYDQAMAEPYIIRLDQVADHKAIYRDQYLMPVKLNVCTSLKSERAKKCAMAKACFEKPEGRQKMKR